MFLRLFCLSWRDIIVCICKLNQDISHFYYEQSDLTQILMKLKMEAKYSRPHQKNLIRKFWKILRKRKEKHNVSWKERHEYIAYQFIAKLNGSILVATLLARATATEHTNPLELWMPYLTSCLHLLVILTFTVTQQNFVTFR